MTSNLCYNYLSMSSLKLIAHSALRGAMAGGVLAIAYTALAIPAAGLLLMINNIPVGKTFDAMIGAGVFALCAWPFAIVLGIIPSAIIGAVGGSIIGAAVIPFRARLSRRGTTLIGLLVAILIVLIAYLVFGQSMYDPRENSFAPYIPYLFWFVGPSIMAILGLTWVGWSMPH